MKPIELFAVVSPILIFNFPIELEHLLRLLSIIHPHMLDAFSTSWSSFLNLLLL